MKHEFALLAGILFLSSPTLVSAQSGPLPNQVSIHPPPTLPLPSCITGTPFLSRGKPPSITEEVLKKCCEKLENDRRRIYYLNTRNYRMSMQLKGIYTSAGMIFFRLSLYNHSHLDYEVDSIRFYITDNRWLKKKPLQITGIPSVYTYGNTRMVRGKSQESPIIVLPAFTLAPGKHLVIEILERNGERRLQLQAYNFSLLRSRLI